MQASPLVIERKLLADLASLMSQLERTRDEIRVVLGEAECRVNPTNDPDDFQVEICQCPEHN